MKRLNFGSSTPIGTISPEYLLSLVVVGAPDWKANQEFFVTGTRLGFATKRDCFIGEINTVQTRLESDRTIRR